MNELLHLDLGEGSSIKLMVGDITEQDADAIVNAANSSLMGGGGVDGAIHRAGGPLILEECKKIVSERGPLPPGHAVATTGGRLRAGYVIHTVGPVWQGGDKAEASTLRSCYRESLDLADRLRLQNIAFPSVSTGAFRFPVREAANVALSTVVECLPEARVLREARFILFDERTYQTYVQAAEQIAATSGGRLRFDRLKSLD